MASGGEGEAMVGWLKRIRRSRRIPTNGPQFDDGSGPYQIVDDWPEKRGPEANTLVSIVATSP